MAYLGVECLNQRSQVMNEILTEEQQKQIALAESYLNGAKNYVVDGIHSFKRAAVMLQEIKQQKKEYDNLRKHLKAPIIEAGKNIEELFRKPIHFLHKAEEAYKVNMLKFEKVERQKIEAEKKEKTKIETQLLEEAEIAIAKGNTERFDNLMTDVTELNTKVVEVPKADGISFRDNWKGEVIDIIDVIKAVAKGDAPPTLLMVNESAINQIAKATKGTMQYPGIRFYNDKIVASRG